MEVLYPRCAGLDVHKETVVAGVRLMTGDGSIRREVEPSRPPPRGSWRWRIGWSGTVVPTSPWRRRAYWHPVWRARRGGPHPVLTNAAHVKNVPGRKTDVADAVWLSDLLAHGLIRPSFVPDAETPAMRDLLRTRKQLVREQASHVQRIQKTLEDANLKLASVFTDIMGQSGRAVSKR